MYRSTEMSTVDPAKERLMGRNMAFVAMQTMVNKVMTQDLHLPSGMEDGYCEALSEINNLIEEAKMKEVQDD